MRVPLSSFMCLCASISPDCLSPQLDDPSPTQPLLPFSLLPSLGSVLTTLAIHTL